MFAPVASAIEAKIPNEAIHYLVTGTGYTRAIAEICALGVADILKKHGPQTAEKLVEFISAEDSPTYSECKGVPIPAFLYRTMRAASQVGLFDEVVDADGNETFANNAVSDTICSDSPLSIRWFFSGICGVGNTRLWAPFGESLCTGKSGAQILGYNTCFEVYHEHQETAVTFQRGMKDSLTPVLIAFPKQIDASRFSKMTDVGGGLGHLLGAILEANPGLNGINYDCQAVTDIAIKENEGHPVLGDQKRVEYVAGDYTKWVPKSDSYVMTRIIHDLNDDRCVALLTLMRDAMDGDDGRIFIVDMVLPEFEAPKSCDNQMKFFFDLLMMVACEASERTKAQFANILTRAGLELVKITSLENSYMSVVEAKKINTA